MESDVEIWNRFDNREVDGQRRASLAACEIGAVGRGRELVAARTQPHPVVVTVRIANQRIGRPVLQCESRKSAEPKEHALHFSANVGPNIQAARQSCRVDRHPIDQRHDIGIACRVDQREPRDGKRRLLTRLGVPQERRAGLRPLVIGSGQHHRVRTVLRGVGTHHPLDAVGSNVDCQARRQRSLVAQDNLTSRPRG